MSPVLLIAGVIAVLIGMDYYLYRAGGRRRWNPLWMAFTLTALALLYGTAGFMGYVVPRHNPLIDKPAMWVGHVVWPQVAWAATALLISGFFWWRGLRHL